MRGETYADKLCKQECYFNNDFFIIMSPDGLYYNVFVLHCFAKSKAEYL